MNYPRSLEVTRPGCVLVVPHTRAVRKLNLEPAPGKKAVTIDDIEVYEVPAEEVEPLVREGKVTHEYIKSSDIVNAFFDIDFKTENETLAQQFETFFDSICVKGNNMVTRSGNGDLESELTPIPGTLLGKCQFNWTKSSRPEKDKEGADIFKVSYHLIFPGTPVVKNTLFLQARILNNYVKMYFKDTLQVDIGDSNIVDEAPYKNELFRLPYAWDSVKPENTAHKISEITIERYSGSKISKVFEHMFVTYHWQMKYGNATKYTEDWLVKKNTHLINLYCEQYEYFKLEQDLGRKSYKRELEFIGDHISTLSELIHKHESKSESKPDSVIEPKPVRFVRPISTPQSPGPSSEQSTPRKHDLNKVLEVVALVDKSIWARRDDWLRLTFALKNLGVDYDTYDSIVKKFPGYFEPGNRTTWDSAQERDDGLGYKCVRDYAIESVGEDDVKAIESKYTPVTIKLKSDEKEPVDNITYICENLTHSEVAKAFASLYGHQFYSIGKTYYIYQQKTGFWEQGDTDDALPLIAMYLSPDIEKRQREIESKIIELCRLDQEDPSVKFMKNKLTKQAKNAFEARKKINSISFARGVLTALGPYIKRDDTFFRNTFDNKPHLFAFECGTVFDLTTGEIRKVQREDYLTMNTGYAYPSSVTKESLDKVENLIRSVQESEECTNFLITTLAQYLYGSNKYEKFTVWTNPAGRNGKGTLDKLCKQAFGRYYSTIDISQLVAIADKGDATNSTFANLKGVRLIMATEPEEGRQYAIKTSLIKKITGGDDVDCRGLYEKKRTKYSPQFSLVLQCNERPNLSKVDEALASRMQVIRFPFEFKANSPSEVRGNIKLADHSLKNSIETNTEWRDAFITYLLSWYDRVNKNMTSLAQPSEVASDSQSYIREQDRLGCWFDEFWEVDSDIIWKEAKQLKELYSDFKDKTGEQMNERQFSEKLKRLVGEPGYKIQQSTRAIKFLVRRKMGGSSGDDLEDLM